VTTLAALVDTGALFKVALYSLLAGVGLTAIFSFGIVGVAKADDLRRAGKNGAASAYVGLALVSAILVIAGVVQAIVVMTTK
jgi:hypothetical protein